MLIEAFTEAKDPSAPQANEDRFVVLPGRAYAVIDGVTDRLGTRYDGMLSGQYAAVLVKEALEALLARPDRPRGGLAVVRSLTGAVAEAYRRHGMLERARTDWNQRFSATLALVLVSEETLDIVLVGDSGVRIDGRRILQVEKDLDRITATLRRCAWPLLGTRVADPDLRESAARRVTWFGTRQPLEQLAGLIDSQDLAAIEAAAVGACTDALPHVPVEDVARLVQGGIVNAQGAYQNDHSTILGYSAIDGFDVPEDLIMLERIERRAGPPATIELFTDGYFKPGASFGAVSWEESFLQVEREDSAKVGAYPSTKGSTATQWADDRTYVGVRF